MSINAADVRCPKCGGPVWDERPTKKNPKGPDFRCKDKTCLDDKGYKTSIWEKDLVKNGAAPASRAAAPSGKQAFESGPRIPAMDDEHPALPHEKLDDIFRVHDLCVAHAIKVTAQKLEAVGITVTASDILAAAATQMIAAQKAGVC